MFSDHNTMKLEINNRRKFWKFRNLWKLSNTLLNNQCVKKKSQGKFKNTLRLMKTKSQYMKIYRMQLKQCLPGNLYLQMPTLKEKVSNQ